MSRRLEVFDIQESDISCPLPITDLFCVEPIGLGTAAVEGLSSLFARSARAHLVSPSVLFRVLIRLRIMEVLQSSEAGIPFILNHYPFAILAKNATYLNGTNNFTRQFATLLGELTENPDLYLLTMLPFSNLISAQRLIRYRAAWCPLCYQEQRDRNQPVYDQLLWSLEAVDYCYTHRIPLQQKCPHGDCGRPGKRLRPHYEPGYCYACNRWLGNSRCGDQENNVFDPAKIYCEFKARQMGELLAEMTQKRRVISVSDFRYLLEDAIRVHASNSLKGFAHGIDMNSNAVCAIYTGRVFPRLEILLKICYEYGIPLCELMFLPDEGINFVPIPSRFHRLKPPCPKITGVEYDTVVEPLLDTYPPYCVKDFASKLGLSYRCLKTFYPDLAAEVLQRRASYLADKKGELVEAVRYGLEELIRLDSDIRIPFERAIENSTLDTATFYRHARDLCTRIVEHNKAQLEHKWADRADVIREAARSLHNQGIYPTKALIRTALGWSRYSLDSQRSRAIVRGIKSELSLPNWKRDGSAPKE